MKLRVSASRQATLSREDIKAWSLVVLDETCMSLSKETRIRRVRLLIWRLRAYSSVWVPKMVDRVKELSKAD